MSSLSVFIPLLNSGLPIDDPNEMLNSADWIGTAQIDFVESQIQITVALATACEECSTEWRLGIRASRF